MGIQPKDTPVDIRLALSQKYSDDCGRKVQIPEDKTEAGSDYQSRLFVIEDLIRHGFVCSVRGSNETKEAYMEQNDDASDDETSNEMENDFLGNLFWENKVPWDPKPSPEDMKDDFYEDVDSDDPEWWEADDIGD